MIYQISSGQGPAECELGVAKLAEYIIHNYKDAKIIGQSAGYYSGTFRSVKIETNTDLSPYIGSVLWICRSPYRPEHKRKNWFLDFASCTQAVTEEFDTEKIHFEAIRSRGKGGQNVNKVETGIRATYLPTGDVAVCMEERTQYLNKQRTVEMLRDKLNESNLDSIAKEKDSDWRRHTLIKRGDASAVFEGMEFRSIQ